MKNKYVEELQKIRDLNPQYSIMECHDDSFKAYGRVIPEIDLSAMIAEAQKLPVPQEGVSYSAGVGALEKNSDFPKLSKILEGELQAGICTGHNLKLAALEYHRSSEILAAATSCILVLGHTSKINSFSYNTKDTEIFYIPQGSTVELFSTTLHFAPIQCSNEGFSSIIVLPKGTNLDFEGDIPRGNEEDTMLFKQNKWILASKGSKPASNGAHVGLEGETVALRVS